MLRRTLLRTVPGALTALLFATVAALPGRADAQAAGYPNKPVTIIVPFTAGGNTDAFARMVGDELDKALGQRFLVENKPGAGGNLGAAAVANAQPDGYTLGMGTVSTHAINPSLYKKLPFDADKGFAPVSLIATLPNVLVVNPSIPANSVPELVELLKKEPEVHTYASSGPGTSPHLGAELFSTLTGTKMTHVPYKGSGQSIMDVVAGHVDMVFDNIPTAAQQAKAGKVRALAVTSLTRAPLLPDVPAMAEFLPGFEATSWHGLFAPGGTPKEIVEKVSAEVQRIMKLPHIQQRMQGMGATPVGNTPEEFTQHIAVERKKWAEVVKASGVSLD
ncbi:tripartite-type tricarboxylate transporter receptor subunit TctC [Skermanella aerolata]|uniref:MFS transporter n=1 Tax=Skermanella aerolata TaxID=393310 RepID=A0A512DMK9_9PROT|nr:tripartite tricarboxylate transporter substrate binding protein [Skermanella aerolata]KJB96610.1 MFS transporter [Skermanella aerolata KACC 11604]GEO37725.1 MFS transporter [Skermanella aerolata]